MKDVKGIETILERLKSHWKEIDAYFEQENNHFNVLFAQDHNLIGRVLKCHLIIEHYLERFIAVHYGIQELPQAKLSFFQKAKLLPDARSAAAFVKPGILRVNAIRNRFGHTLRPVLLNGELGAINKCLAVSRRRAVDPIDAIEAFTSVPNTI